MQITVYKRHAPDCPKKSDRNWRRCKCPCWHYSVEWGKPYQRSAKTRSWDEATDRARLIEQGQANPTSAGTSVADAVKSFLKDVGARNLSENYAGKLTREMNELAEWAKLKPVPTMQHWTLKHLEEFRGTWTVGPVTRRKRQERLRSFFLYCKRHGWITDSPASNLSAVKVVHRPTVPFTKEQWDAILKHAAKPRTRAMLLLLRWSGLRLGDAARLAKTRISKDGKLLLYMAKTGQPVYVPLPPFVTDALKEVKNENPDYFFWSGTTHKNTPVYRWWETLKAIFKKAGLPTAHPHQIRDTFAVELLLAGVPIDQVSMLLGHSSVKITEKHYAPWVLERQKQLEDSVQKAWGSANVNMT